MSRVAGAMDALAAAEDGARAKDNVAVAGAKVAAAEEKVFKAEGKVAEAGTKVAAAEVKVEAARDDVTKAKVAVVKAAAATAKVALAGAKAAVAKDAVAAAETKVAVAMVDDTVAEVEVALARARQTEAQFEFAKAEVALAEAKVALAEAKVTLAEAKVTLAEAKAKDVAAAVASKALEAAYDGLKLAQHGLKLAQQALGIAQSHWADLEQELPSKRRKVTALDSGEPALMQSVVGEEVVMKATAVYKCPEKCELTAGGMVDVSAFEPFLSAGSTAKALFVRECLPTLHAEFMARLTTDSKPNNIAFLGCPGVGKSWLGLLVAHSLIKDHVTCLHVTVREKNVKFTDDFSTLNTCEFSTPMAIGTLLKSFFLKHSRTTDGVVAVVDVGGLPLPKAAELFSEARFARGHAGTRAKIMLIGSAQGKEVMLGNLQEVAGESLTYFMPSWTEEECHTFREEYKTTRAFYWSGGSARQYDDLLTAQRDIEDLVKDLDVQAVNRFLGLRIPTGDLMPRQMGRLLAYYPRVDRAGATKYLFGNIVVVPRSQWVVKVLLGARAKSFDNAVLMWRSLSETPARGAAGSAFEFVCDLFWEMQHRREKDCTMSVYFDGKEQDINIPWRCMKQRDWFATDGDNGYYKPPSWQYPVDAVLKVNGRLYALQYTVGKTHKHGEQPNDGPFTGVRICVPLLLFCPPEHECVWTPATSESWILGRVTTFYDFAESLTASTAMQAQ